MSAKPYYPIPLIEPFLELDEFIQLAAIMKERLGFRDLFSNPFGTRRTNKRVVYLTNKRVFIDPTTIGSILDLSQVFATPYSRIQPQADDKGFEIVGAENTRNRSFRFLPNTESEERKVFLAILADNIRTRSV